MTTATVSADQVLAANTATQAHINLVRRLLRIAATELHVRGELHDLSKFDPEEVEMYAVFTPRLRGMEYNGPEYKACLAEMGPGLKHHYANNRHHPEHYGEKGIEGMTLIDLLEMAVDWMASSRRHATGDIFKSIESNRERFKLGDQLYEILRNTALEMLTLEDKANGKGPSLNDE